MTAEELLRAVKQHKWETQSQFAADVTVADEKLWETALPDDDRDRTGEPLEW